MEQPQYDANENDKNGKIGFLVGKLWDIHSVNCSYTYLPNPVNIGQTFHAGLQIQKHKYKYKYTNTASSMNGAIIVCTPPPLFQEEEKVLTDSKSTATSKASITEESL